MLRRELPDGWDKRISGVFRQAAKPSPPGMHRARR